MSEDSPGPISDSVLGSLNTTAAKVPESDTPAARQQRPDQIGNYRLIELLGEGGMGEVFKAERRDAIHQIVAIKVVKLGMNSREIVGRFESERQALALMDHPGIARVIDAGTTDAGRPYFVMDFVAGKPITEFCDDNSLSIEDRLKLFMLVCDAINHAHTKAIIHRDIKPTNVLAYFQDGVPAVKVIDFGIAKAIGGDRGATGHTFFTAHGQAIGTYDSMSPEQADGSPDIDTRTDVYSLGVMLYELLTGAKPFDPFTLARSADAEIKRIIRDVEPPRPSTRLSSLGADAAALAGRRQAKLEALASRLRSELEWIPLKAMRKERGRRYASPAQLADDLRRYLEGKPLLAGPETRVYRVRKFVHRNRAGVLIAAIAIVAAIGGSTFYVRGIRFEQQKTRLALIEAEKQRSAAVREKDVASAVSNFLTERVLLGVESELITEKGVRDAIVKAMLEPAAAAVEQDFKDKPVAQAAVRASLAQTYVTIGRGDLGLPQAEAALALRRIHFGDDGVATIQSIAMVGEALRILGKHAESEQYYREALERCRRVFGPDDESTLGQMNNLAAAFYYQERFDEALPLLREAIERGRQKLGPDNAEVLRWRINLGGFLTQAGQLEEAERVLEVTLVPARRAWGDDSPNTINLITNLGSVQTKIGKTESAEPLLRGALRQLESRYGTDHPQTLGVILALANNAVSRGMLDEAAAHRRMLLASRRRVLGDDDQTTLHAMNGLGSVLLDAKKYDEAAAIFREAMERGRRTWGYQASGTVTSTVNLASALFEGGQREKALGLLREALSMAKSDPKLGAAHKNTQQLADALTQLLTDAGKSNEAAAVRSAFPQPVTQPAALPTNPRPTSQSSDTTRP